MSNEYIRLTEAPALVHRAPVCGTSNELGETASEWLMEVARKVGGYK